jgi:hypothetical protein
MSNEAIGFCCFMAAVIMGALYLTADAHDRRRAFMAECQMDGMKHYQCVSLWNGGGIPVFRSRDMIPLDVN